MHDWYDEKAAAMEERQQAAAPSSVRDSGGAPSDDDVKDAKRWRAVRAVASVVSIGVADYYLTTNVFLGDYPGGPDGYADAILASSSTRAAPEGEAPRCADCGVELNEGTAKVFEVCDACWDKAYPKPASSPGAPTPAGSGMSDDERAELNVLRVRMRGADRIAAEAEKLVRAGKLDARSPLGDALLDYVDDLNKLASRLPASGDSGRGASDTERLAKIAGRYEWAKNHWAPSDFTLLAWLVADQLSITDSGSAFPEQEKK